MHVGLFVSADCESHGYLRNMRTLCVGVGADEEDLIEVASELDPRFAVCSLRGPLKKPPGLGLSCASDSSVLDRWGWFDGMSIAPEKTSLESLIARSCDKAHPRMIRNHEVTLFERKDGNPAELHIYVALWVGVMQILDFLNKAPEEYGTDASQTYLFGFSQGATMVCPPPQLEVIFTFVCVHPRHVWRVSKLIEQRCGGLSIQ
eukprot:4971189-Pyramimonas_sp.AAC.1